MSNQPNWKLVAQLGDAHPIDHGGVFVYEDTTGVYAPEVAHLEAPEDDSGKWIEHRYILEPCTFINGILSDNKFHPGLAAWFAKPESERGERPQDTTYLKDVADQHGEDVDTFAAHFLSDNVCERAMAWEAIGSYHGFANLNNYPNSFTRKEIEARYPRETWKV